MGWVVDVVAVSEAVAGLLASGAARERGEEAGGGLVAGILARVQAVFGSDARSVDALEHARRDRGQAAVAELAAALAWYARHDAAFARELAGWAAQAGAGDVTQRVDAGRDAFTAGRDQTVIQLGVTLANDEDEMTRARNAVQYLEDRRVLYDPFRAEYPRDCIDSVRIIRTDLAARIDACRSAELRDPLRRIQAACRKFLTDVQGMDIGRLNIDRLTDSRVFDMGRWQFNQALGTLRAQVGMGVAIIIERFDIDVDEKLASILPPPIEENDES